MKAAAYARYSTDRQTENSIAYQLQEIRSYCQANDIPIVATYTDAAVIIGLKTIRLKKFQKHGAV